jgi:DNA polymerase III delta prime subunit
LPTPDFGFLLKLEEMKSIITAKNIATIDEGDFLIRLEEKLGKYKFAFLRPKDQSYKIDEIKDFIKTLRKKQSEFTQDIFYLIMSSDSLSTICQNALLKTLEESPYNIGLVVENSSSLLPTIHSRCSSIQIEIDATDKKEIIDPITINDIAQISKLDRNEAIKKLETTLASITSDNFQQILAYQNAIDKLKANCKIEAVLYELLRN